jgi:predicted nucleotidyltransferase
MNEYTKIWHEATQELSKGDITRVGDRVYTACGLKLKETFRIEIDLEAVTALAAKLVKQALSEEAIWKVKGLTYIACSLQEIFGIEIDPEAVTALATNLKERISSEEAILQEVLCDIVDRLNKTFGVQAASFSLAIRLQP